MRAIAFRKVFQGYLKKLGRVLGLAVILSLGAAPVLHAATSFLFDAEIKSVEDIRKFPDDELINRYVDVLLELEASTTFSRTAGFTQPDYFKYKKLLRYRADLFQEITRRELDVPGIGQTVFSGDDGLRKKRSNVNKK